MSQTQQAQADPQPARPPVSQPTTQMAIGCLIIPLIVAVILVGVYTYIRTNAAFRLTVPDGEVVQVRATPEESAPLLARFGEGRTLKIIGRARDWRWLEVEIWDGQRGWTLRPLDILVWRLRAPETSPQPASVLAAAVTPVSQEMITIPTTNFTMGSPPGLGEPDEEPAHPISISAFAIDQTEVTVGQYWQCVEAGACAAPNADGSQTEPHYLNDPAFDNYPVINVPWLEANRYCTWLGKRLPTEAEWELAAGWDIERTAKSFWPWGNEAALGQANVGNSSVGDPAPVGSFPDDRSPLGVMDMAGNVSEWVFDWYKVDYYSNTDNTDPIGPSQRRGEGTGRVVRGASFADPVEQARTSNRSHQEATYGYPTVGFRCARDGQ
jgi:formylglycine-generating enzyme required for sulfatase activity